MPTYTSPGVYVTESAFTTTTVTGPATTAAAFIGTAQRGPTTPVAVESWGAYKEIFGDISSAYELGYALYHFFANGGRTAYVCRVVGSGASNAAATASTSNWSVKAANPGTWGNNLTVVVDTGLVGGSTPTFTLTVKNNGAEVERWAELSLNPDSSRFINSVVNNYSKYVTTYNVTSYAGGASYNVAAQTLTLAGGADGSALTDDTNAGTQSAWAAAVDSYDAINGQLLMNLVGKSNAAIITDAIAYVEGRGNSFLIIDPDASLTDATSIKNLVTAYGASSYAAVYYGMLSMTNPAAGGTAALRNTYPGGALAGLYTRVDNERSVAKAPAGYAYDLRNTFGVVTNFTESQVGELYAANINTLKAVPGGGVIVNGARTLKKTDLTKYIPVRRSLNFIKANTQQLTQFAVFEPNGERLWADISAKVSNFLSSFWATGGLRGANAGQAYYVLCNSTNNTAATIENGEVHVEVGVALQTPAEFVVINISQFVGGTQVQENL